MKKFYFRPDEEAHVVNIVQYSGGVEKVVYQSQMKPVIDTYTFYIPNLTSNVLDEEWYSIEDAREIVNAGYGSYMRKCKTDPTKVKLFQHSDPESHRDCHDELWWKLNENDGQQLISLGERNFTIKQQVRLQFPSCYCVSLPEEHGNGLIEEHTRSFDISTAIGISTVSDIYCVDFIDFNNEVVILSKTFTRLNCVLTAICGVMSTEDVSVYEPVTIGLSPSNSPCLCLVFHGHVWGFTSLGYLRPVDCCSAVDCVEHRVVDYSWSFLDYLCNYTQRVSYNEFKLNFWETVAQLTKEDIDSITSTRKGIVGEWESQGLSAFSHASKEWQDSFLFNLINNYDREEIQETLKIISTYLDSKTSKTSTTT